MTGPAHHCKDCGGIEYDDQPHNHPKEGPPIIPPYDDEMEKACEIQKVSDADHHNLIHIAAMDALQPFLDLIDSQAKEIAANDGLLSRWLARNEELTQQIKALEKNLHEECAASAQTISLLREQLKAHEECQEDAHRLTKELDDILSGDGAAERPMLCDVIKTARDVMEQVKAKDTALEDIRVNTGRDMTSTQWIVERAEQGLEGK